MKRVLYIILTLLVAGCQNRNFENDEYLWSYYEVTEPNPALVDSLISKTRGHVHTYLQGLYYRDSYRLRPNEKDFVKADSVFGRLIDAAGDEYYGYAGRGLMYTEKGMSYDKPSDDSLRQANFDLALDFLKRAVGKADPEQPDLAMLYFYMGKNEFYRYRTDRHSEEINVNAIYYLDLALQRRRNFYKAYLRSAQYLSDYTIIAESNKLFIQNKYWSRAETPEKWKNPKPGIVFLPDSMNNKMPRVHDRIKYLFRECIKIKPASEIYISMAAASLTYSDFTRISFLDSAEELLEKDPTEQRSTLQRKIYQKRSEIYYTDLKLYKTALANYKKWLLPKDDAKHWVARAWCLFHGDSTSRSEAFSTLRERINIDSEHADQYLYAMGMMDAQIQKPEAALSELDDANKVILKNRTPDGKVAPNGYIQIEIAKLCIAMNNRKRAKEVIRYLTEEYYNEDDPYLSEIAWNADRIAKFYKLQN